MVKSSQVQINPQFKNMFTDSKTDVSLMLYVVGYEFNALLGPVTQNFAKLLSAPFFIVIDCIDHYVQLNQSYDRLRALVLFGRTK